MARGREPAPIVYKGDAVNESRTGQETTTPSSAGADRATQRVSFAYPGESATGSAANNPSTTPAQQYASISEPLTVSAASDRMVLKYPGASPQPASEPAPVYSAPAQSQITTAPLQPVAYSPSAVKPQAVEQGPTRLTKAAATPAASYQVTNTSVPMFDEIGGVVIFGSEFSNMPTASGEILNQEAFMAAHPSVPLPSLVQVRNAATGKEVVVRVNDRGPYEDGAVLQVTEAAARALGLGQGGQDTVSIRYLGAAPKDENQPPVAQDVPPPAEAPSPAVTQFASVTVPASAQTQSQPVPVALQPVNFPSARAQSNAAGSLYVQVGAFSEMANAQEVFFLLNRDFDVVISPARVNGSDFFRVRVGPLATHNEAEQLRARLMSQGMTGARIVTGE